MKIISDSICNFTSRFMQNPQKEIVKMLLFDSCLLL